MNKAALRAMDGRAVRLFPPVQRYLSNGLQLPPSDDLWRIEARDPVRGAVARLYNTATGHFFDLFPDGVREYREPNALVLGEQLAIVGKAIVRTPLAHPMLAYAAYPRTLT